MANYFGSIVPEQILPYNPQQQQGGFNFLPQQPMAISGLNSGSLGGGLGSGGFFSGMSGLDKAQLGLGALNSLYGIWGGIQANNMAKKQFRLGSAIANTNLDNSIKSYNTSLEGRARARGAMEGQTDAQVSAYIDRNRLSRS